MSMTPKEPKTPTIKRSTNVISAWDNIDVLEEDAEESDKGQQNGFNNLTNVEGRDTA